MVLGLTSWGQPTISGKIILIQHYGVYLIQHNENCSVLL